MGAAGDLGADKGVLAAENMGIHPFQRVPSVIVITVAGASVHVLCADPVFLECLQDLELIVLSGLINAMETFFQSTADLTSIIQDRFADAAFLIHVI